MQWSSFMFLAQWEATETKFAKVASFMIFWAQPRNCHKVGRGVPPMLRCKTCQCFPNSASAFPKCKHLPLKKDQTLICPVVNAHHAHLLLPGKTMLWLGSPQLLTKIWFGLEDEDNLSIKIIKNMKKKYQESDWKRKPATLPPQVCDNFSLRPDLGNLRLPKKKTLFVCFWFLCFFYLHWTTELLIGELFTNSRSNERPAMLAIEITNGLKLPKKDFYTVSDYYLGLYQRLLEKWFVKFESFDETTIAVSRNWNLPWQTEFIIWSLFLFIRRKRTYDLVNYDLIDSSFGSFHL